MRVFRHPAVAVGLVAAAALGLRAWVADAVRPVRLQGDELYYVSVAANLALGDGHHERDAWALRPPAHPFTLSFFIDPEHRRAPHSVIRMVDFQIAVGTALVIATALLGRALFDARTGVWAAAITALDPTLVFLGHYLWSEALFALLVTAALTLAVAAERRGGFARAAAAGAAFGVAALTREIGLVAAAACGAWWVAVAAKPGRPRAALRAAALIAAALAVVAPWVLRNQRVVGRPVISTVGWFTLAEGNTLPERDWLAVRGASHAELKARYLAIPDELRRERFARRWALERIRAEQPWWLGKKLVRTIALLASPDSIVFDKLRDARYPALPPGAVHAVVPLAALAWPLLLIAGVGGIAGADARRRALPVLLFGAVAAVHVLANATSRFRVPWLPLLAVYAAHAGLARHEVAARLRGRGGAVALAALAVLLGIGVPYFFAYQSPGAVWNAGR